MVKVKDKARAEVAEEKQHTTELEEFEYDRSARGFDEEERICEFKIIFKG